MRIFLIAQGEELIDALDLEEITEIEQHCVPGYMLNS
jgi:hypothetical protein